MGSRSEELRVALDLARRLGLVDAARLKRVRDRLDAQPADPEPPGIVGMWLGLPDVLFDALLVLARTLPRDASDTALREGFRLQTRGKETLVTAVSEGASTDAPPTLRLEKEDRRPGLGEQPSLLPAGAPSSDPATAGPSSPAPLRANVPKNLGPYELQEELGHGGMGVVFRARHQKLGTLCAIKVLIAGEHASPEAIARFQREAAAVARMGKHPNIVNVFDLGQEGPLLYYGMELIYGAPLSKLMKSKEFSPAEAATLVEKVARAIHFAHEHGIIHRDVKPDNVVVREDGEPQVMDFGLARDIGSAERISVSGEVMGTLAYMAPEQARGDVEQTDARTDVYALGGLLYEILTGFPPHPGRTAAVVFPLILAGDIVPPRSLRPEAPRDLETICVKCLALEPGRRYATAQALAEDLARWRTGEPILARPVGRIGRTVRRIRRHPLVYALMALVVVLAAGLAWRFLGPARLVVDIHPPGAKVTVNGKPLGDGGWVWPAGSLFICAEARGYEPLAEPREVPPGRLDHRLSIDLKPREGTLSVSGGVPGCTVTVRDPSTHAEVTRLFPPTTGVKLRPGAYLLEARAADSWDRDRRIAVAPGEDLSVHVSLGPRVLWRLQTEAPVATPVALGDLDRDGVLDCVFVTADGWVHAVSGKGRETLWKQKIGGRVFSPCSLADMDGDGVLDCAVAANEPAEAEGISPTAAIYALSGRDGSHLWPPGKSDQLVLRLVHGDLNGDGLPDLLLNPGEKRVSAVCGGKSLWRNEDLGNRVVLSPEARDLDGDGAADCVVCSSDQHTYAVSGSDKRTLWFYETRALATTPPVPGDFNGDGVLDVVAGFDDQTVRAISGKDREVLWKADVDGVATLPPALGLDLDGRTDCVVVACGNRVYALSASAGDRLWKSDLGSPVVSRPVPGDLTGDGVADWTLRVADGRILGLSGKYGHTLWTLNAQGRVQIAPSMGDVDGDGLLDCVFVSGEKTIEAVSATADRLCWGYETGDVISSAPATADIDRDGLLDVIVGSQDDRVCVLSGRDGSLVWRHETGGGVRTRPGIGDLNGDGIPDSVVGSDDHTIRALSGRNGAKLWSVSTGGEVRSSPAMADLNGDGVLDVVIGSNDWQVRALSGRDGSVLWSRETGGEVTASPALADLNADGVPDCIVGSYDKRVVALSGKEGSVLWRFETGDKITSSSALADLDGDGVLDGVIGSLDGTVYALSGRAGVLLWKYRASESIIGTPVLALRKGHDIPDCVACSRDGRVFALSGKDGAHLWTFATGAEISASPCVVDLGDPDGPDVLVGSRDGRVYALSGADGAPLWSCAVGGPLCALVVVPGSPGEILAASEDHWLRALVPVPRNVGEHGDPVARMALLASAGNWSALIDAAGRTAQDGGERWNRAMAQYFLGLALFHLDRPPDALAAFAEARKLGLRSPEAAVYEWLTASGWAECGVDRRSGAWAAVLFGMAVNADAVFDTFVLCRDSLARKEVLAPLGDLLRQPDLPKQAGIVTPLLLAMPLDDGVRPLLSGEQERLVAARKDIVERIEGGEGSLARWLGYLALVADALSEADHFDRLHQSYFKQPRRPPALDMFLTDISRRRVVEGGEESLTSLLESLTSLAKLLGPSERMLEITEKALALRPDDPEAQMNYAEAANGIAWQLATGEGLEPDPKTGKLPTDPARAITLAEKAVKFAREAAARDPAAEKDGVSAVQTLSLILDTLAAAYAARDAEGDLDRAIAAQEEALRLGPRPRDVTEMQERLDQYRSRRGTQK